MLIVKHNIANRIKRYLKEGQRTKDEIIHYIAAPAYEVEDTLTFMEKYKFIKKNNRHYSL